MERSGGLEGMNQIFIWFSNLAYLNFLWVVFSLFGMIVLGIAPSTSALFAVIRKLHQGEEEIPITKTFFTYYRKDFWMANALFYILFAVGAILVVDMFFLYHVHNLLSTIFLYLLIVLSILYIIMLLFIFPVFVHFDLKLFGYIKQAFLIGMMNPLYVVMMVISLMVVHFILIYFKTLFFIFGGSLSALIIMATCDQVFKKLKQGSEIFIREGT